MDRFKVGDKVVVTGYVNKRTEYYYFNPKMDSYIGLVTRIRRVGRDGSVNLDIDGGVLLVAPLMVTHGYRFREGEVATDR
jgi:hypothetical protein